MAEVASIANVSDWIDDYLAYLFREFRAIPEVMTTISEPPVS